MITIGSATSFKNPDNFKVKPDNRKIRQELYQDWTVIDLGVCGNTITCNAVFDETNFAIIQGYANAGTAVTVTDNKGNQYTGCVVVVDDWGYVHKNERYKSTNKFVSASLVIWTR